MLQLYGLLVQLKRKISTQFLLWKNWWVNCFFFWYSINLRIMLKVTCLSSNTVLGSQCKLIVFLLYYVTAENFAEDTGKSASPPKSIGTWKDYTLVSDDRSWILCVWGYTKLLLFSKCQFLWFQFSSGWKSKRLKEALTTFYCIYAHRLQDLLTHLIKAFYHNL